MDPILMAAPVESSGIQWTREADPAADFGRPKDYSRTLYRRKQTFIDFIGNAEADDYQIMDVNYFNLSIWRTI